MKSSRFQNQMTSCIEPLESRQLYSVTVSPNSLTATEKTNRPLAFATFTTTDAAPLKTSKYVTKLSFGDGKRGAAKVVLSDGTFTVLANHIYKQQGIFKYTLVVSDRVDKTSASVTGTVIVNSKSGAPYTDLTVNESNIFHLEYGGNFRKSGLNYTNGTITATRVPDTDDGIFPQAAGIVSARAIAAYALDSEVFGYIPGTSGGSIVNLFSVQGVNSNVTGSSGAVAMSGPFRLAADNTFSSVSTQNGDGRDHLITYVLTGVAGQSPSQRTYVLFWEDTTSASSDFDYNDLVVELKTNAF